MNNTEKLAKLREAALKIRNYPEDVDGGVMLESLENLTDQVLELTGDIHDNS